MINPEKISRLLFFTLLLFLFFVSCRSQSIVLTGLDQIHDYHQLFAGKKVGLITNHTAVNRAGDHILDIFGSMTDVHVTALFGPEHGVRGKAAAGEFIENTNDPFKDVSIYSLYGATKKPTPTMLRDVDLLVFDIQDVGARFYTYIWTLYYAMQAAAENNVTIVVLDRPNPIGGKVEGPVLEKRYASFIGLQPIPIRHGMTVGEIAQLFQGEEWLGENLVIDLKVVPIKNWQRNIWHDETSLEFIAPSPNMPNLETATIYPGTCLLEGTNVSEGRGTDSPFLLFGAPWINGEDLCERLNVLGLAGILFEPTDFTPISMPGKSMHPKYENKHCFGARIKIADRTELETFPVGIAIIKTIFDLYPEQFQFRQDGFFEKLVGTDKVRNAILAHQDLKNIQQIGSAKQQEFRHIREKYLIYPNP